MSGRCILIVEDYGDLRWLALNVLNKHGYYCVLTNNGAEALEFLKRFEPPHAVVADLEMPVMDGLSLSRRMQQEESLRHIPVILYSSLPDLYARAASEAGITSVIYKDGSYAQLIKEVDRVCASASN